MSDIAQDELDDENMLPVSPYAEPAKYTNNITTAGFGDYFIMEFRAFLPIDLSKMKKGVQHGISVTIEEVPPHTRILMSNSDARVLRDMLNRAFPDGR